MKVFVLALFVVAAGASLLEEPNVKFQEFKVQHGKTYKNPAEETKRFSIFNENLRSIEEHNALYDQGLVSYKKGINQFTDMTQEEVDAFLALSSSAKPKFENNKLYVKSGVKVPASVDWRTSGQVTAVKNQRTCGGCWAFSLTGCIEAAHFRKTKQLISLSEQQLIDCAPAPNQGCNGGVLDYTYIYIKEKGLESEQRYPFIGYNSRCKYNASTVVAKVDGAVSIKESDEKALLEAVATVGPISIAMQAKYLSSYAAGIYSESKCNPQLLDHAVLVVGYGSENGKDYWIVKNSWGPNWGEKGYFRIARGVNMCGVAMDAVYPTIK